ncbi:MAG: TetR/AcrR family transcriptional regulator [Natronosporangium sp.]
MQPSRRTQADRSATTRAALIAAGRRLFAEPGFARIGAEAIVGAADVSRGALYHHFGDKTELFAAVLEQVEREVAEELAAVLRTADPDDDFVAAMTRAIEAWLDACERQEVQRIVLLDGPSVLGWTRWREICQPYILGLVEAALTQAIADGIVDPLPVKPLAHALLAVADEAALFVASAPDKEAARSDMVTVAQRIVRSLTA